MPTPPRKITHAGRTRTISEWARATGITAETIRSRIDHQGWNVERALTTPAAKKFAARQAPLAVTDRPAPRMLRHKGTNRAYAKWSDAGTKHVCYFGAWASAAAASAYQRFTAEWAAGVRTAKPPSGPTVTQLVAGYLKHVAAYYVRDGKPTSEQHGQKSAMRVLVSLYGSTAAADFKPKHLKACQKHMIALEWARGTINQHTWRITRAFSWGVAEELVPAATADALAHVPNLQAGRSEARDPDPVMSADEGVIAKTLPHLDASDARRAVLTAMVQFHLRVGCRPGELCAMTADRIDASGDVWLYRVVDKNTHRQTKRKPRKVWIGPEAQMILRPFLADPGPGGRIWCYPPRWPKSPRAKRAPISRGRYSEALLKACKSAGVEPWHPHQLRHNRATAVQRIYESDDAAAAAIGDTPEVTKAVYADPSDAVAKRIALATG